MKNNKKKKKIMYMQKMQFKSLKFTFSNFLSKIWYNNRLGAYMSILVKVNNILSESTFN